MATPALVRDVMELVERADRARGTPDQDTADSALAAAPADVVAALRELIDTDPPTAARVAGALSGFWQDTGRVDEGRELTARIDAMGGASPVDAAKVALVSSDLAFRQGDQHGATDAARRAIDLARAAGDVRTEALAELDLARVAFRSEDGGGIESHSLAARAIAPGDAVVERGVVHMLGWAAYTAGRLDEARERFEESLALRRAQGGKLGIASELGNLGELAMDAGDRDAARRLLSEALEIALDLGSQYLIVNTLPALAALTISDDPSGAARLFGAAEAAARTSGLTPDPGGDRADERRELAAWLGQERFDLLAAEGSRLTPDAIASVARSVVSAPPGQDPFR